MKDELKIIEKAYPLFQNQGAKTVTMNDISSACGISKKTLYEHFPNKETLLYEVIELTHKKITEVLNEVVEQDLNAIEETFQVLEKIYTALQTNDDVFLYQLYRYYPQLHNQCNNFINETIYEQITKNLIKGKDEKLYRDEIDIDIYAKILLSNIQTVKTSDVFQQTDKSRKELTYFIIDFYLNSITTNHGKEIYNQIKSQYA